MVFYFSGTGNSLYVAKKIAERLNDRLISVAAFMCGNKECFEFCPDENEAVGFVFPVYAWGPPGIILRFIEKLRLANCKNANT